MAQAIELELCKRDVFYWFHWWPWTYDPRAPIGTPATVPFDLYPRQAEMIDWLMQRIKSRHDGLLEKSRDVGFTWTVGGFAWHHWRFTPGFKTTFGSRKMEYVDRIGDPDCIFEKIRLMMRSLPPWMLPYGWKPDKHDNHMLLLNPENGNTIRGEGGDEIGRGGRALPLDSKVLTPAGWQYMADMKVGSRIIGRSGRAIKVTGVFPQGVKQVYRVWFSDGASARCCGDHLWEVTDGYCRKNIRDFPNSTIRPRKRILPLKAMIGKLDMGKPNRKYNEYEYQIPLLSAPVEYEPQALPVDPYLLGALLGNGSLMCTNGKQLGYTGGVKDHKEMFGYLLAGVPAGVTVVHECDRGGTAQYRLVRANHKSGGGRGIGNGQGSPPNALKAGLLALGLIGRCCYDKFIPECYLCGSPQQRLELLRGLMDTDGQCTERGVPLYSSTSEQLARGVVELAQSLGGIGFIRCKAPPAKHPTWAPEWAVELVMPDGMNPFRLQRKALRYHDRILRKAKRSIIDIKPEGNLPMQCITVDAEDGLFVTDEYILTHNSTLYIIDEAAFIERAERADASTSSNSDTRIWASTVSGMQNLFARKRHGGQLKPEQIFRIHWRDDPRKDEKWAAAKQASLEPHVWASEFEIDYAASVEGTCIPAAWVESAKKVAKLFKPQPLLEGIAGGDIGAGKAMSVCIARFGPIVLEPEAWKDPDTIDTAMRMLDYVGNIKLKRNDRDCRVAILRYDSVGIGHGISSVMRRNPRHGLMVIGVNTGEPPSEMIWPDGETSKEKFANLKAEAWWQMREKFKITHEAVMHKEGNGGHPHHASDLISLPTGSPHSQQLAAQLPLVRWSRNERGKIAIETKRSLSDRGVASPDYADSLAMSFTGGHRPLVIPDAVMRWAKLKERH